MLHSLPIFGLLLAGLGGVASAASQPEWKKDPYLKPVVGVSSFTANGNTSSAVSLGGEAGLRYWQRTKQVPRWSGRLRGRMSYLINSVDAEGIDIRVGNFIGPRWKSFGLQVGPDVFWNQYTYGRIELEPTSGVGFPVTANAGTRPVTLHAGFEPSWFLSSPREGVDWSAEDSVGFGDEFSLFGGVGLDLEVVRLSVSISRTVTAYGTRLGYAVGFNLR